MRVLVCGGRDYNDVKKVFHVLDQIHADGENISVIIEGEARGADVAAAAWACSRGVPIAPYPAQWGRYGNGAGPIRNRQMLIEGKPDLVVAFPGREGTANMVAQARKAGVPVEVIPR